MRQAKSIISLCAGLSLVAFPLLPRPAAPAWPSDPSVNVPLCTAPNEQARPVIISDGAGGAIVAWQDARNDVEGDSYAQRVSAGGAVQWATNGVALCSVVGEQYWPHIISDGAGGAIVAWDDGRRIGNGDIYAQRVSAAGMIQWGMDGAALCTASGDQFESSIAPDDAGGAIVGWVDHREDFYWDIYAQRISAAGAVLWAADGVALCTDNGHRGHPALVSDSAGGAVVTWLESLGSSEWQIRAQRISAAGVVQWGTDGTVLCTDTGAEVFPCIASDGAGGAVVAWWDLRNSGYDIYAQRISAGGEVRWTPDGVPICLAGGRQNWPIITPDGEGGAIVAWEDLRNGVTSDIFAQRISATGWVQWTSNGVAVCAASGDQDQPTVTLDDTGGAIFTWMDERAGNWDVYAQRMSAGGSAQWAPNGVAVCTATGRQRHPTIASDGAAGAIVGWWDLRSGINYDIYAQRVLTTGHLGGEGVSVPTEAAPVLRFELGAATPNPFAGRSEIPYTLAAAASVRLAVYDVGGHLVRTLITGNASVGDHLVAWDGRDDQGLAMPSGVYYYRLTAGGLTATKSLVMLK